MYKMMKKKSECKYVFTTRIKYIINEKGIKGSLPGNSPSSSGDKPSTGRFGPFLDASKPFLE
jgi:hypothetical protein